MATRDQKLQEAEKAHQSALHSLQCLKSLNDSLIADKNSTKTAHEEKMKEFLANYEIVCEKLAKAEAGSKVQEARVNQLENQCKLYEETVVVESEEKCGDEKYEKMKAELEYECGVADDLKRQLQRVVDEREEMGRNVAQLNEWWQANSVGLEEHNKLVGELREAASSAVKERVEMGEQVADLKIEVFELRAERAEVEKRLNQEAEEVRLAGGAVVEERDGLRVKLQAARMSMESLEAVREELNEKLEKSIGRVGELEEALERIQGQMDESTAAREKAVNQCEVDAHKVCWKLQHF